MPGRGGVRWGLSVAAAVVLLGPALGEGSAAAAGRCGNHPWCDTRLSPDQRAGLLLAQLTQDDKITLLTGGAVPRLDVPGEQWTDGGVGAGGVGAGREGATAMPAGTALAAGFDTPDANAYGTVVGNEVRNRGFDGVWAWDGSRAPNRRA